MRVHLVVPAGFEDRPSGGNVYDRHLRAGLAARGWDVVTHHASPDHLAGRPDGLVLVDGLVASWAPEAFTGAVPLVHMLFDVPGEHELLLEAPAVVATSRFTKSRLARAHVDPRRVHVAVPGVERSRPWAGSAGGGELLCVAALTPAKGQDVLLAALAWLTDLDWSLTVAGPPADAAFTDLLRKQAAHSGVADRVRFAGALSRAEVDAAYACSDLLVLPSRAETYGMVVTEALAHGLPVVASAVGGVPEALGSVGGDCPGMRVRPDDPEALARSLRRWLEDAPLRRRLRDLAHARRRTLPTWSATAAAVAGALGSVP